MILPLFYDSNTARLTNNQQFVTSVILSDARLSEATERKSKDPDNLCVLIAVESLLSMLFARKHELPFPLLAFSRSFDSHSSRKLLSRVAQDDIQMANDNFYPSDA